MWRERERSLAEERSKKYLGTASVSFKALYFPSTELDEKNVQRLIGCFREQGCNHLELENHIPAVIQEDLLGRVAENSGISANQLFDHPDQPGGYPKLEFTTESRLECLHGRHRVEAGRAFLPVWDQRWSVDLYSADIGEELRAILSEGYSNAKRPHVGKIYREIRHYSETASGLEGRWRAKLTPHERKALNQLSKSHELEAAFDALLDVPGLWGGMRASTLHKIISTKCDEEIIRYLHHIYEVWFELLGGNIKEMQMVDQTTVGALERKAPGVSNTEAEELETQIRTGKIFSAFSEQSRENISARLRSIKVLIPSLSTFFKDLRYLEACAEYAKRLVQVGTRETVFAVFYRCYAGGSHGVTMDTIDFRYRQIFISAMRNYSVPRKNKKNLLTRPSSVVLDERALYESATHANELGFESDEISDLTREAPERKIFRDTINMVRKPENYAFDNEAVEKFLDSMEDLIGKAKPIQTNSSPDSRTVEEKHRSGLPIEADYEKDKPFLSIENLHREDWDEITSLFVRRCVYLAFFYDPPGTRGRRGRAWRIRRQEQGIPARGDQFRGHQRQEDRGRGCRNPEKDVTERGGVAKLKRKGQDTDERREPEEVPQDKRRKSNPDLGVGVEEKHLSNATLGLNSNQARTAQVATTLTGETLPVKITFVEVGENKGNFMKSITTSDPSPVISEAQALISLGYSLFDTGMRGLTPNNCFQDVTADGSNTIYLVRGRVDTTQVPDHHPLDSSTAPTTRKRKQPGNPGG